MSNLLSLNNQDENVSGEVNTDDRSEERPVGIMGPEWPRHGPVAEQKKQKEACCQVAQLMKEGVRENILLTAHSPFAENNLQDRLMEWRRVI